MLAPVPAVACTKRAAARLVRALGEGKCAIAGGLAVGAHGFVRGTDDVDLLTSLPLAEAKRRLAQEGIRARHFRGQPRGVDFDWLTGRVGEVPFDVLPAMVPFRPENAVIVRLGRVRIPVVDFETLVRLKLKAGALTDLLDLAMLVLIRPRRRALVMRLATMPELRKGLLAFLGDPRLKREARSGLTSAKR